jgi:hypothetical protein
MTEIQEPVSTLKTEQGHLIRIRELFGGSLNVILEVNGESFGIHLTPQDAREFAITLKLIAEAKMLRK